MGKRNKEEPKVNNIKTKKNKSVHNVIEDATEEISCVHMTGNGKNSKIVFNDDESSKIAPLEETSKELYTKSNKGKNNNNTRSNTKNTDKCNRKQNKKTIFTDDGTEVTVNRARKISPFEEDPGDEEIDKFCDEIDEEDNVQYDNWVKLIEAKLGPNKKK